MSNNYIEGQTNESLERYGYFVAEPIQKWRILKEFEPDGCYKSVMYNPKGTFGAFKEFVVFHVKMKPGEGWARKR